MRCGSEPSAPRHRQVALRARDSARRTARRSPAKGSRRSASSGADPLGATRARVPSAPRDRAGQSAANASSSTSTGGTASPNAKLCRYDSERTGSRAPVSSSSSRRAAASADSPGMRDRSPAARSRRARGCAAGAGPPARRRPGGPRSPRWSGRARRRSGGPPRAPLRTPARATPRPRPTSTGRPSSRSIDVTPASRMPQGTMSWKSSSAAFTFSAKPWVVIHRAMCTPTAPIFRASPPASEPTHTPGPLRDAARPRCRARRARGSSPPPRSARAVARPSGPGRGRGWGSRRSARGRGTSPRRRGRSRAPRRRAPPGPPDSRARPSGSRRGRASAPEGARAAAARRRPFALLARAGEQRLQPEPVLVLDAPEAVHGQRPSAHRDAHHRSRSACSAWAARAERTASRSASSSASGGAGRAVGSAPPLGEQPQLVLSGGPEALQGQPVEHRPGKPAPRERLDLLGRMHPPAADLLLRLGQRRVQRQNHRTAPEHPRQLPARSGLEPVHVVDQHRPVLGQRVRAIPRRPQPARGPGRGARCSSRSRPRPPAAPGRGPPPAPTRFASRPRPASAAHAVRPRLRAPDSHRPSSPVSRGPASPRSAPVVEDPLRARCVPAAPRREPRTAATPRAPRSRGRRRPAPARRPARPTSREGRQQKLHQASSAGSASVGVRSTSGRSSPGSGSAPAVSE